jgi:hypothetical protein
MNGERRALAAARSPVRRLRQRRVVVSALELAD